jgi:hypothetical protein
MTALLPPRRKLDSRLAKMALKSSHPSIINHHKQLNTYTRKKGTLV